MVEKIALTLMVIFVFVLCIWLFINKGTDEDKYKKLKEAISLIMFSSIVLAFIMVFITIIKAIWLKL